MSAVALLSTLKTEKKKEEKLKNHELSKRHNYKFRQCNVDKISLTGCEFRKSSLYLQRQIDINILILLARDFCAVNHVFDIDN